MANFWQIKKKDYYSTAIELKKRLPWLKSVDIDEITDHLRGSGLGFVKEESVKTPYWMRLTLPFGLIFILLLLITSPIKYMVTGTWGYKVQWIANWLKALGF